MARVFNEGLEARDFRYYIPQGRSLEQMQAYDFDSFQFSLDVQRFTNKAHGDAALLTNRRWKAEVLGLSFNGHAAPAGWVNGILGTKVPAKGMPDKSAMEDLWVNHAHSYLGAMPQGELEEKFLVPVARPVPDKWVIASPVVNGKAFVPQDAIEIDLPTYATLTGQSVDALQSPATDEAYRNPFSHEYPFRPREAAPAPAAV